jgi:hypothetical protein
MHYLVHFLFIGTPRLAPQLLQNFFDSILIYLQNYCKFPTTSPCSFANYTVSNMKLEASPVNHQNVDPTKEERKHYPRYTSL